MTQLLQDDSKNDSIENNDEIDVDDVIKNLDLKEKKLRKKQKFGIIIKIFQQCLTKRRELSVKYYDVSFRYESFFITCNFMHRYAKRTIRVNCDVG